MPKSFLISEAVKLAVHRERPQKNSFNRVANFFILQNVMKLSLERSFSNLEFSHSVSRSPGPRTLSVRRARFEQNQDCSYHWQGHHQQSYNNVWPRDVREQDASVLYSRGAAKGSKHQCPQIAGVTLFINAWWGVKEGNRLNSQDLLPVKNTYINTSSCLDPNMKTVSLPRSLKWYSDGRSLERMAT